MSSIHNQRLVIQVRATYIVYPAILDPANTTLNTTSGV